MWGKFKKFLLKESDNLIGIDIGTGAIKIVEVIWEKGKPILKNFGIKELPPNVMEDGRIIDSQQLTEILSQLLANTQTTTKNAVVAVGGKTMFARELLFPTMTKEELGEAMKWDLEKYIPYAPNTYYFDYSIVGPGTTPSEIKVLLVASPLDHIDALMTIINSVGLKLIAIDVEPLALYRIFDQAETAIVIDVGAFLSQVTVFQNGSPAVIRNIPIGGQNFSNIIVEALRIPFDEAEQLKQQEVFLLQENLTGEYLEIKEQMEILIDEFIRDVRRTAEYYQQENSSAVIDKVLITGGGAKLSNLREYFSSQTYLPSVIYDPLSKLIIPATFDKASLQQMAPQLGTAIGLALRGGDQ
jgi:type IV pilus assembly protein PilM